MEMKGHRQRETAKIADLAHNELPQIGQGAECVWSTNQRIARTDTIRRIVKMVP